MLNFQTFWQRRGLFNILLLPLAALFAAVAAIRRRYMLEKNTPAALPPVIIVGSIVAGGSGKTPVVLALAKQLATAGWKPGIVSRGYGGAYRRAFLHVEENSDWQQCGDEPLLIRRRTQCPVCVGRKRLVAAKQLAAAGCDIIISDDGLQHYALPRTLEICVIDAAYRFGNGWRLPAGPLREPVARADQCDFCLFIDTDADNKTTSTKTISGIYALAAPTQPVHSDFFTGKSITAIAGIARAVDFFTLLEKHGIIPNQTKALADHAATILDKIDSDVILMTEKDSVKYDTGDKRLYAVAIDCTLPDSIIRQITKKLAQH